ncbi:MAG: metal ABC transporter permease [Spirochaetaceae bacterium]|jgi:zinc transport system permease protein|nr:metal ABC transporter permease [Spirochaetaceae bacterium]
MISLLMEMFSYAFLVRAFVVGFLVSLCASLLGVSLVLKRYSMIGDGLSHVGFGTLAIATALNAAPLAVSLPVVVAAAFLLLRLSENSTIKGDAAIAIVSTGALALGVMVISLTTGMNTDVCNYLFGSILAMTKGDVFLSIILSATVLILFCLFYHKIFAVTFDETFAKATGTRTGVYNMLIAFLTAVTIVLGMRMMGALLISSLIIFPALTSMRLCKQFKTVTVCSALVSLSCFFIGVVISYLYATPTGASVVMMNIVAFLIFWGIKFCKRNIHMKKTICAAMALSAILSGCGPRAGFSANKDRGSSPVTPPGAPAAGPLLDQAVLDQAGLEGAEILRLGEGPASGRWLPPAEASSGEVVEIREKMFITQTNDVYLNPEDYMGKTIKLEGIFKTEAGYDCSYCFVIRYGPGCCGYDGSAGFEVAWGVPQRSYPAEDAWVEAVGVLSNYEEDGFPYLYLSLSDLTVKDERGAEYVVH